MAGNWTDEQRRAIESRAAGILVSAAAGSGKTTVLVERIIRKILDGGDTERMLVSTFTNAAAASMREKIYKALKDEHAKNPADPHIRRQLTMVYGADIGTIHSFCSRLIRSSFFEAGVAPDFKLMSDDEARIMKARVMSRTLDELFEEGGKDFTAAAEMFVRKNSDKRFSALLLGIYEKLIALPFYEDKLKDAALLCEAGEGGDIGKTVFGRELISSLQMTVSAYQKVYATLSPDLERSEKYGGVFSGDMRLLSALSKEDITWDEVCDILHEAKFSRLPQKNKKSSDDLHEGHHERYKAVRDALKKDIEKQRKDVFTDKSASLFSDLINMAPAVRGLSAAISAFVKNYREEKDGAGALDFNDLEQTALSLLWRKGEGGLEKTELAAAMSQRYDEIFIDEYQDLNNIQELIFGAISRGDGENLFMVGDVKQSIYGFRQADPGIFLKKYKSFNRDESAEKNALILLSTNFRSHGETLSSVNAVFSEIMSSYAGELDYTRDEFLKESDLYKEDRRALNTELYIIQQEKKEKSEEYESESDDFGGEDDISKEEQEARLAARLIRSMMRERAEVFDVKTRTHRPAGYGDFAVLLRSVNPTATVFERVFQKEGIPVNSQSKEDFFSDPDVLFVLALLRCIDNPLYDIPLASVMRSPVFGFSDDEIMAIRLQKKDAPLYMAAHEAALSGNEKCAAMLSYIKKARLVSGDMSAPEFLDYIYETTMIKAMIRGLGGADARIGKLDTLQSIAFEYEKSHYSGLFNFILYIDYLIENKIEISAGRAQDEGEGTVKIMSIHRSKGLEFPVCIIAGLDKRFNMRDTAEPVLFDGELGFGCDFFDKERLIYYPLVSKLALKEKMRRRVIAEEMRTLYVAMTRAQEKLILIGTSTNIYRDRELLNAAEDARRGYFTLKSSSYLDFLVRGFKIYKADMLEYDKKTTLKLSTGGEIEVTLLRDADSDDAPPLKETPALKEEPKSDVQKIRERLSFKYPYSAFSSTPAKLSATEIKGRFLEVEKPYGEPEYVKETIDPKEGASFEKRKKEDEPRKRGTAMHLFMELVDFSTVKEKSDIKDQAATLVQSGKMTESDAELLDIDMLWRFFETPISKRMKNARRVFREKRFFMSADAADFYDVPFGGADVMVQGVIDCFFEDEEGRCVLIDFKTDRTKDAALLKRRYKGQLDVYKRAVSEVFGKRCAESYIYSFYLGRLISADE